MLLKLLRERSSSQSTLGSLYINSVWQCWTLEDVVRETKVPGITAIPFGHYSVVIDDSVRFKRKMPHVLNVPGFEGIRIHSGNTSEDTEGCILVGMVRAENKIIGSKVTFDKLFDILSNSKEDITLEVANV